MLEIAKSAGKLETLEIIEPALRGRGLEKKVASHEIRGEVPGGDIVGIVPERGVAGRPRKRRRSALPGRCSWVGRSGTGGASRATNFMEVCSRRAIGRAYAAAFKTRVFVCHCFVWFFVFRPLSLKRR